MLFDKTILQIQNEGDKIEKEISASNTEHAKLEKEMQSIIDNTAILKADLKENISDLIQIA